MADQPQEFPKPNPATIIVVQRRELERLNDSRIYLMAIIEDIKNEAGAEIQRLNGEIAALKATHPENSDDFQRPDKFDLDMAQEG